MATSKKKNGNTSTTKAPPRRRVLRGWKSHIPYCFGIVDVVFGGHPLERERAGHMLLKALALNAAWADVEKAAIKFMESKDCGKAHIQKQLKAMRQTTSYFR